MDIILSVWEKQSTRFVFHINFRALHYASEASRERLSLEIIFTTFLEPNADKRPCSSLTGKALKDKIDNSLHLLFQERLRLAKLLVNFSV